MGRVALDAQAVSRFIHRLGTGDAQASLPEYVRTALAPRSPSSLGGDGSSDGDGDRGRNGAEHGGGSARGSPSGCGHCDSVFAAVGLHGRLADGSWSGDKVLADAGSLLGRFVYSPDPLFDSAASGEAGRGIATTDRFDIDTTRAARFEPHADAARVVSALREQADSAAAAHLMARSRLAGLAGNACRPLAARRILEPPSTDRGDPNATDEATGDDPSDVERALARASVADARAAMARVRALWRCLATNTGPSDDYIVEVSSALRDLVERDRARTVERCAAGRQRALVLVYGPEVASFLGSTAQCRHRAGSLLSAIRAYGFGLDPVRGRPVYYEQAIIGDGLCLYRSLASCLFGRFACANLGAGLGLHYARRLGFAAAHAIPVGAAGPVGAATDGTNRSSSSGGATTTTTSDRTRAGVVASVVEVCDLPAVLDDPMRLEAAVGRARHAFGLRQPTPGFVAAVLLDGIAVWLKFYVFVLLCTAVPAAGVGYLRGVVSPGVRHIVTKPDELAADPAAWARSFCQGEALPTLDAIMRYAASLFGELVLVAGGSSVDGLVAPDTEPRPLFASATAAAASIATPAAAAQRAYPPRATRAGTDSDTQGLPGFAWADALVRLAPFMVARFDWPAAHVLAPPNRLPHDKGPLYAYDIDGDRWVAADLPTVLASSDDYVPGADGPHAAYRRYCRLTQQFARFGGQGEARAFSHLLRDLDHDFLDHDPTLVHVISAGGGVGRENALAIGQLVSPRTPVIYSRSARPCDMAQQRGQQQQQAQPTGHSSRPDDATACFMTAVPSEQAQVDPWLAARQLTVLHTGRHYTALLPESAIPLPGMLLIDIALAPAAVLNVAFQARDDGASHGNDNSAPADKEDPNRAWYGGIEQARTTGQMTTPPHSSPNAVRAGQPQQQQQQQRYGWQGLRAPTAASADPMSVPYASPNSRRSSTSHNHMEHRHRRHRRPHDGRP